MLFLAGDIGGTKALLQLIEYDASALKSMVIRQQRFLCQDFDSLESVINTFLSSCYNSSTHLSHFNSNTIKLTPIDFACFGLPGPVMSKVVRLTNLPWQVDASKIEQECGIQSVTLVNDFYAAALGVRVLKNEDFFPLYIPGNHIPDEQTKQQYLRPSGHCLVVGAGTGLGVAPVYFDGKNYLPVSSEGGHFDFAPISETQQYLLSWLWKEWKHVSYERVLSGSGLETLYRFFKTFDYPTTYVCTCFNESSQNLSRSKSIDTQNNPCYSSVTDMLTDQDGDNLTAEEIYQAAELGEPIAVKALTEFVTIYGAFVGAVSLVWNAPHGVYLAGGIALKLIRWLEKSYFRKAFLEKGRMSKVVAKMPVYIANDEWLGLKGAMQHNVVMSQGMEKRR